MFENNENIIFGDDLVLNFEKNKRIIKNKCPYETPPKKPKIVPVPKTVVKRKFPGPAGILPEHKDVDLTTSETLGYHNEIIPCSQRSVSIFQSSPWLEMSRDYDTLLEHYNIEWIKTAASNSKLLNQRAPFLGAVIKNVECCEGKKAIVKIVLKDGTGEIQGTMVHSLFEEYIHCLVPDSVIVLKQCSVITTSYNNYLTITPNNLVSIYWMSADSGELVVTRVLKKTYNEGVSGCSKLFQETNRADVPATSTSTKQQTESTEKTSVSSSQVVIKATGADHEIWSNELDGVDLDALFDDF